MRKLTKIAAFLFALVFATSVHAQESERVYEPAPYTFIGVQGGVQNTIHGDYNNWKTFTPTAAFSIGHFFNPQVGLRLNVNGAWSKGCASTLIGGETGYYKYNYLTTSADVLVNLCTLIGSKDYYPVNVYLIGGLGYYHAWNNDDAVAMAIGDPVYRIYDTDVDRRNAFNGRLGLQLEFNICRNVAFNIEGSYNLHVGQSKSFAPDNRQLLFLAGFNFKFGHKKVVKEKPIEPVYTTVVDTIWYNEDSYEDVYKDGNIDRRIFFDVRESDVESTDAQLAAVAEFLKGVQQGEISITAYADKGTGNPKLNMEYSKLRAQKTQEVLIGLGVDPSIIKSVDWKGDTVQPYPEDNDKNRVSIITGHGIYKQQKKVTNRRFRTEERKVRVQ